MKVIKIDNTQSILKAVQDEYDTQSKSISPDDTKFTAEIIEPYYDPFTLMSLRDISDVHDSCIQAKAEDITLSGHTLDYETELPTEIANFFEDYSFDENMKTFMEDLKTFGFACLELLKDSKDNYRAIKHLSSLYVRPCSNKEMIVQKIGTDEVFFKLYKKNDNRKIDLKNGKFEDKYHMKNIPKELVANEVLWFKTYNPYSDWYGRPDYISAVDSIFTDGYITKYHQGYFKAKGVPNYIITVTGNLDTEDDNGESFEESMEQEFKDITNEPGTAMVFVLPSQDNNISVNVNKIGDEKKEGSFLELEENTQKRILSKHKVPAERIGLGTSDGMASNRTQWLFKIYSRTTISNEQKSLANLITTKFLKGFLDTPLVKFLYNQANFDDDNALLEAGIKKLQNGGLTLGEFINKYCAEDGVTMDETDPYYDVRLINNQSLDSVIFADNQKTNQILKKLADNSDILAGGNIEPTTSS